MRHPDILHTIGRTPAVRLSRLAPPHVELYVKLEAFNPMGSVKDRMALAVLEEAEASGRLQPGQTVVEATSGNTGIGLAMVCARKGHPLVIVMAENFSVERRRLMRFLGARVVLTPAALKGSGMLAKARELAATNGWFLPRQFENEANAAVHTRTTAVEILDDFRDAPLTHWVTGSGTGGTLLGVGRRLRAHWPATRIVLCEPDNAPVLASGIAAPPEDDDGLPVSHPQFRPHLMQGWTPDFVPALVQRALAEGLVDEIVPVAGEAALATARDLARSEAPRSLARCAWRPRCRRAAGCWRWCPIPASATSARRCSPTSPPRWTRPNGRSRAARRARASMHRRQLRPGPRRQPGRPSRRPSRRRSRLPG
jgi:cysteine synthase A